MWSCVFTWSGVADGGGGGREDESGWEARRFGTGRQSGVVIGRGGGGAEAVPSVKGRGMYGVGRWRGARQCRWSHIDAALPVVWGSGEGGEAEGDRGEIQSGERL